jgi:recombination protein RecT
MTKESKMTAALDKSRAQTQDSNVMKKAGDMRTQLADFLEQHKEQIRRALPRQVSPERLIRVVMTAYNLNPALQHCSLASIYVAVIQSAQLDLECDGLLGQAWLVPFKGQAKFMIGYQGHIQLIYRGGYVSNVYAHAVYEKDDFDYEYGTNQFLKHKESREKDRGGIVYFYAMATLKDGKAIFEVKTKEEVDKIRATSRAKDSEPWTKWYVDMGRKTVLRGLMKWLPKSAEQNRALKVEESLERDIDDIEEIIPDDVSTTGKGGPDETPPGVVPATLPPSSGDAPQAAPDNRSEEFDRKMDELFPEPDKKKEPTSNREISPAYADLLKKFDSGKTPKDFMALMKESKTVVDKGLITQAEFKELLANTNKILKELKK